MVPYLCLSGWKTVHAWPGQRQPLAGGGGPLAVAVEAGAEAEQHAEQEHHGEPRGVGAGLRLAAALAPCALAGGGLRDGRGLRGGRGSRGGDRELDMVNLEQQTWN